MPQSGKVKSESPRRTRAARWALAARAACPGRPLGCLGCQRPGRRASPPRPAPNPAGAPAEDRPVDLAEELRNVHACPPHPRHCARGATGQAPAATPRGHGADHPCGRGIRAQPGRPNKQASGGSMRIWSLGAAALCGVLRLLPKEKIALCGLGRICDGLRWPGSAVAGCMVTRLCKAPSFLGGPFRGRHAVPRAPPDRGVSGPEPSYASVWQPAAGPGIRPADRP